MGLKPALPERRIFPNPALLSFHCGWAKVNAANEGKESERESIAGLQRAQRLQQRGKRKWLLQKQGPRGQLSFGKPFGVSGHEKDLDTFLQRQHPLVKLRAAEAGHDDVGDK